MVNRLMWRFQSTEQTNDSIGMQNLIVPTVPQKPDIVLQLTKNDLQKDMKMTYLFDAKYRIAYMTFTVEFTSKSHVDIIAVAHQINHHYYEPIPLITEEN